jgi:leader peptidase (prepilin peptidase)/N-methyltransferase
MTQHQIINATLHFLVFCMGAGIGSFLNVVIYRMPRGISVNKPRRSFCPACNRQIPFYENIPVLSWLLLRGRCSACGAKISARYIGVEILVGALFYALFASFGGAWADISHWGPVVLCLWIFAALLVAGTFIDIEHYILPHEITIGGTVAGLLASLAVPSLQGEATHLRGLLVSLGSAGLGIGLLWAVVELGKLAFGRKKHVFDKAASWEVTQPDDTKPPVVRLGDEDMPWEDIFSRASDRMLISCEEVTVNDHTHERVTAELWMERLKIRRDRDLVSDQPWEEVKRISGRMTQVVIPREAMGFGDVLFLMMIGSFAGWKCVLFTILAASIIGTLVAMLQRVTGRAEWSAKIPFGPYLAVGALIWLFYGQQLLDWYLSKLVFRGV